MIPLIVMILKTSRLTQWVLLLATSVATMANASHEQDHNEGPSTWPQTSTQASTEASTHNSDAPLTATSASVLPDLNSSHYFLRKLLRTQSTHQTANTSTALSNADLNPHPEYQHYLEKTKSKRRQLSKKWMKPFKLSLFNYQDDKQKHHFHFNTLRQELVGKVKLGEVHYSLRASRKKAMLSTRYRF